MQPSKEDIINSVARKSFTARLARVGIDTIEDLRQELWVRALECGFDGAVLRASLKNHCRNKIEAADARKRQVEWVDLDRVATVDKKDRNRFACDARGKTEIYHPYKHRAKSVDESESMRHLRMAGYNALGEEFIYPGRGSESLIWILRTGNYNCNSRFEDDAVYVECESGQAGREWVADLMRTLLIEKRSNQPIEEPVSYRDWVRYGGCPPQHEEVNCRG